MSPVNPSLKSWGSSVPAFLLDVVVRIIPCGYRLDHPFTRIENSVTLIISLLLLRIGRSITVE
jgi:hypothetical protein